MKRNAGLALTFLVAVVLAVPPTLYAEECYTSPNRYIGYFSDCGCTACAGWAMTNCTECTDGNGNWCQTTSTNGHCGPLHKDTGGW